MRIKKNGARRSFVATVLTTLAFVAVGCTGSSEADGPSPVETVTVEATPDATASPEATVSPEATPTGTTPEPSASEKAGLVVTKYEDEGVYTLVLAPLSADQPSLEYLEESADLRNLEDLPGHLPYSSDLWAVEVSMEVYDKCKRFDEYENSAC